MNAQVGLLVLLSIFSVNVAAELCKIDHARKHWAEKLEKNALELGLAIKQAPNGVLSSGQVEYVAHPWVESMQTTAEEVDRTMQTTATPENTQWLVTLLLSSYFTDTANNDIRKWAWVVKQNGLTNIEYDWGEPDELYITSTAVAYQTQKNAERCANAMNCTSTGKDSCRLYLQGWTNAANRYINVVVEQTAENIAAQSVKYGKQWQRFFDESRSQTFIERLATAHFYADSLKDTQFSLPPQKQVVLIHPSVLLEYVDAANDGDQFKAALAIEWFGINYWDRCFNSFNIGCGASIMSSYTDRAGINDHGLGIMIHIDNSYSLGTTYRDGDYSFLLSVDLLKAFSDKKSQTDKWLQTVSEVYAE
jgi:hypothetical protein